MNFENENARAGDFYFATRVGPSATEKQTRAFVGLATSGASLQGVRNPIDEPSRLTNLVGMGYDADEDREPYWHVLHSDWGGPVKRIPIYVAPCNTTDDYDLVVTALAHEQTIAVVVTNRTNGESSRIDILTSMPATSELVFVRAEISSALIEEAASLGLAHLSVQKRQRASASAE